MKKSECFKLAQIAVINNLVLEAEEKLEIISVLMSEESLSRTIEDLDEKRKENKENEI